MLSNTLFWDIITFISTAIEWLMLKFILDELSNRKSSNKTIRLYISTIIFIICFFTINNVNPNTKLIVGILMGYLLYSLNYNTSKFKAIVINLAYWMILIGLDFITSNIVLTINQTADIKDLLKNDIYRLQLIIISKIILIAIIPIIKSIKLNIVFKKKEIIYVTIVILTNISSILVIFTLSMNCIKKPLTQDLILLSLSSMLILSNMALIKIIGKIIKANNIEFENKLIKEKMYMQYKYYLNMKDSQLKIRKLYHDMNNHIMCIKNLYEGCREVDIYINDIKSELNTWRSIISTGNIILDIIVNDKNKICIENNVNFEVDINFSKCNFIDMIDICSIFSNLIDNAIEASLKIDDKNRYIKLKGDIVNNFFVLKCENNKLNKINLDKKAIITDKKDKFTHGIGIKSIESSVKKYNGEMSINFTEDKFKVLIYIPLK